MIFSFSQRRACASRWCSSRQSYFIYACLWKTGFYSHTCILHFYYHSFTMCMYSLAGTPYKESKQIERVREIKSNFIYLQYAFSSRMNEIFFCRHLQCTYSIQKWPSVTTISNLLSLQSHNLYLFFEIRIEVARLNLGHKCTRITMV